MGTGVRVFLIEDDGQVKSISAKRFQKLLDGVQDVEQLQEYAGQRLRIAFVTLEGEGGKPVAIERIDRAIVRFDGNGRVDNSHERIQGSLAVGSLSWSIPESSEKRVIDASSRFARKLIAHKYFWRLTADIEEAIERAIFVKKRPQLKLV